MTALNKGKGLSADHIPSFASLKRSEEAKLGCPLSAIEEKTLKNNSLTLVIETKIHESTSQTFGGRNSPSMEVQDANNPLQAISSNVMFYRPTLSAKGYTNAEIDEAQLKLSLPFLNKTSTGQKDP